MRLAMPTWFPADPATPRGGVEAVSVNLTRALARIPELDVHVITFDSACADLKVSEWEGATIHRLPAGVGSLLRKTIREYPSQLRTYLEAIKPDVVHAHDTYGIMVKDLPFPRIFTVHGFIHEDTKYGKARFSGVRSMIWKKFEISSWAKQPYIVSISPYVRERLTGTVRGKIHDIENPIALDYFDAQRNEEAGVIFCAASVCERKNTLGLVRAFEEVLQSCPDASLRLAGGVSEPDYLERVESFIAEHKLEDHVQLLGSLPAATIKAELARASIFALVSLEEGAPMGIAEAMAMRVPVVTSNRCGMPYMVRDYETGRLVSPDDSHEIAGAIIDLLKNRPARHAMAEKARAFAEDHFHPDHVARRTLAVYRLAAATRVNGATNAR